MVNEPILLPVDVTLFYECSLAYIVFFCFVAYLPDYIILYELFYDKVMNTSDTINTNAIILYTTISKLF